MSDITIKLSREDAKILQAFWGSWFGNAPSDVCLGDLQMALDNLQFQIWSVFEDEKNG